MAEEKSRKGGLAKTFLKAATIGLSISFGFYVMGTFDFIMFHELQEGQAFLERTGPAAANLLRSDIPFLGFSVADTFVELASWFPAPGTSNPMENDAMLDKAFGGAADVAEEVTQSVVTKAPVMKEAVPTLGAGW